MTSETAAPKVDPEVAALRAARSRPAVLKLELARLRSAVSTTPILAFEGDDDKIVYGQWVKRIRPDLVYVSFPCNGKDPLLSLRHSLQQDATSLNDGVYFLADRDFDDLKGYTRGNDIFLTDQYAVENYLVTSTVLDSVLQIEFHCHAAPHVRAKIMAIFQTTYDQFLEVTKEINLRLYVARKLSLRVDSLPKKLGTMAIVALDYVKSGAAPASELVCYESEPDCDDVERLAKDFEKIDPKTRYRGKFALMFFTRWLAELAEQGKLKDRGVFCELTSRSAFRLGELTLTSFASKSDLPIGLDQFVKEIRAAASNVGVLQEISA